MKKLFVSSTFMDMQLERDVLKKRIVPDLNMRLRGYGTKISQTDLRWGISTAEMTAEEGEQKVLNVCLDEIDKSRPYMIVMIGDRYGWTPSTALIELNARGRGMRLTSHNISVTQLEIEYIAFTEKWDESRIFFYFRDFEYGDMDAQQRKIYESESSEAAQKLAELKNRIAQKFPGQIRHYTLQYENGSIRGIEAFEKMVTEDLYTLFCRDMQQNERINVNVRVRDKQHAEAMDSFLYYDPHYDICKETGKRLICSDPSLAEKRHFYLAGSPRCGKTLSVQAHYAAFYAWQHPESACWEKARPLFHKSTSLYEGDGLLSRWPQLYDPRKTFPLYIQLGSSKDIRNETDFLRTFLYYLNALLDIQETLPITRAALMEALCLRLRQLSESDRCFFLFADDFTPQALRCLFEIEHAFSEEEIAKLMEHFFFYIAFNNQFSRVPSYVPFYEHCEISIEKEELYAPADYFMAYAQKLGKELSPGVLKHIIGYYGGYGRTFENAGINHITRPHANLMANYFLNFTSEDYRRIKEAGNNMQAIETCQLEMLNAVRGNWDDDYRGDSLKKVAALNIEKFEVNHSRRTLKMLGILYILAGISLTMEEAEQVYARYGVPWSDLEYISYFDDFKEFFLYNKEEDSYHILPLFQGGLRRHFVEEYYSDGNEMKSAIQMLITVMQSLDFYESKRTDLFRAVLLVPDTEFVRNCFTVLFAQEADEYTSGKIVGENVGQLMKQFTAEETRQLGSTLAPILATGFSCEAINGFFDGIGQGFQNHDYEKNVKELAQALSRGLPETVDPVTATCQLGIALLNADCYLGWKNDKALQYLFEAEAHLAVADMEKRVRYLAALAGLLPRFQPESPIFARVSAIVQAYLPPVMPLNCDADRALHYRADLFSLAYYVKKYALAEDFYDPDQLLEPFLNPESFCKMGLYNISVAIIAQDGKQLGMDVLVERTRMFMECLSAGFPDSAFACRLINMCLLSRMFHSAENNDLLEKYYYPYQKAVLWSKDGTAYHYMHYGLFLQNSRYFHRKTGITHSMDEAMWQATEMGNWPNLFRNPGEESIDLILLVCWSYIVYLQDPDFHDMLSTDGAEQAYSYSEEEAQEPSLRAMHYRLTLYLAAVLHNPNSRIMKPRLKRLFHALEEHYGEYMSSLSSLQYKVVKRYIDNL